MDLSHRFRVPASVEEAWTAFNHLDRIAPCFPGATITTVSGNDFEGSIKVKLGPVALVYNGRAASSSATPTPAGWSSRPRSGPPGQRHGHGPGDRVLRRERSSPPTSRCSTDLDITGKPAQFGPG